MHAENDIDCLNLATQCVCGCVGVLTDVGLSVEVGNSILEISLVILVG